MKKIDYEAPLTIDCFNEAGADVNYVKSFDHVFHPHLVFINLGGFKYYMLYDDYGVPCHGSYSIKNSPPKKIKKSGYIHLYKSRMGAVYSVGPYTLEEYPDRRPNEFIAAIKIEWEEDVL